MLHVNCHNWSCPTPAAVDPEEPHRAAAARALREFCAAKRKAAHAAAQRAALAASSAGPATAAATAAGGASTGAAGTSMRPASTGGGGTTGAAGAGAAGGVLPLRELPEFMLPFTLFILSQHPDLPRGLPGLPPPPEAEKQLQGEGEEEAAEEEEEAMGEEEVQGALQPFSQMLQAALEPILLAGAGRGGGGGGGAGVVEPAALLPVTRRVLHSLKVVRVAEVRGCFYLPGCCCCCFVCALIVSCPWL